MSHHSPLDGAAVFTRVSDDSEPDESQNLLPHLMPRMSGRQRLNPEKIYATGPTAVVRKPQVEIYENPSEFNYQPPDGSVNLTSFGASMQVKDAAALPHYGPGLAGLDTQQPFFSTPNQAQGKIYH